MRVRVLLLATLLFGAIPGCATGPEEARCPALDYASLQYAKVLDPAEVRLALEGAGYDFVEVEERVANVQTPPGGVMNVRGVVAFEPGLSSAGPSGGRGTLVTFIETVDLPGGEGRVVRATQQAGSVVNASLDPGDRAVDRFILGTQEGPC